MENRLADQIELLRLLAAKGIDIQNGPEVKLLTKMLDNEYDYGHRTGVYEATGVMPVREYGTGAYKR